MFGDTHMFVGVKLYSRIISKVSSSLTYRLQLIANSSNFCARLRFGFCLSFSLSVIFLHLSLSIATSFLIYQQRQVEVITLRVRNDPANGLAEKTQGNDSIYDRVYRLPRYKLVAALFLFITFAHVIDYRGEKLLAFGANSRRFSSK